MKKLAAAILALICVPAMAVEIAFEQDSTVPLVYINVAVKAGSVTDPAGASGLTNFLGETMLRGTKSRTKEQLDLALDQMGATLEVETRAEALIFRGAVLAAQLEPFLSLVAEVITQPSFPETEIRKLKAELTSAILEELGHDSSLASRRFNQFLFQDHPYGKPVLGKTRDIQGLTVEKLQAHYDKLFQSNSLLVVGAGDALSGRIEEWAQDMAATRPNRPLAAGKNEKGYFQVSRPLDGPSRRLQIVDKPDRSQTQINFGQVGIRMTDPDFFPLHLGNHAFGGGSFTARMMIEVRVKRGWSYGANSYFRQGLQPRSWQGHLFPAAKDAAPALELVLKMVDELERNGLTEEEFSFAQQSLVNSAGFMYNTPKKRVENTLLERTLNLPNGFMKDYEQELKQVKREQVNAALSKFLKPDRLAVTVLGTAKDLKAPLAKAAKVPINEVVVQGYQVE